MFSSINKKVSQVFIKTMSFVHTDAVPRYPPKIAGQNLSFPPHNKGLVCLDSLLSKLSVDDFKSLFFLLLKDFIKYEDYIAYVKRDKAFLKQKFIELYDTNEFNENLLIELFGTLKNFEILETLGTCQHIFEHKVAEFSKIDKFWKFLYNLCEEVEDVEIVHLKENLLGNFTDQKLDSMEEVFCYALLKGIVQEANLSKIKEAFSQKSVCLSMIETFIEEAYYYTIKTPTQNQHCGLAVIINHEDFYKENEKSPTLQKREGSQKDVEKLEQLWKQFGFETKIYNKSMTDEDVLKLFKELALKDHSNYDAFVACYLSHGRENVLYASNSEEISIRELIDLMANKCSSLIGKPKLFFIQACQGEEIQQGLGTSTILLPSISKSKVQADSPGRLIPNSQVSIDVPHFSDVLTVISTYPGFVSYRSTSEGSWFISSLVEIMQSCGDKLPMLSIIQRVTNDVSKKNGFMPPFLKNCKQIVPHQSTLRYELRLKRVQM